MLRVCVQTQSSLSSNYVCVYIPRGHVRSWLRRLSPVFGLETFKHYHTLNIQANFPSSAEYLVRYHTEISIFPALSPRCHQNRELTAGLLGGLKTWLNIYLGSGAFSYPGQDCVSHELMVFSRCFAVLTTNKLFVRLLANHESTWILITVAARTSRGRRPRVAFKWCCYVCSSSCCRFFADCGACPHDFADGVTVLPLGTTVMSYRFISFELSQFRLHVNDTAFVDW